LYQGMTLVMPHDSRFEAGFSRCKHKTSGAEARIFLVPGRQRLLKNSEKQVPGGLKSARDAKFKGLIGTTKVVP